jgi:putative oxidoreductase
MNAPSTKTQSVVQRIWQLKTMPDGGPRDVGLLLLRVGVGLLMLTQHGWGKMMSFSEKAAIWADPIGVGPEASLALAILAEVLCAAFVVIGLATRGAAVPLVITMLVAAFIVHWDDPFQKKELALLFLIPFLTLIMTGAGKYSIDGWLARRRETSGS